MAARLVACLSWQQWATWRALGARRSRRCSPRGARASISRRAERLGMSLTEDDDAPPRGRFPGGASTVNGGARGRRMRLATFRADRADGVEGGRPFLPL